MLQIIVLAGGAGEKLWPLSRQKMPKQFLKLLNDNNSLFENTIIRISELKEFLSIENNDINIIVVCNESNKFMVKDQIENLIDKINYTIIAEPINRNTTAAIAAALEISKEDDNILILPSDQIWDNVEFSKCIKSMLENNHNGITLLGITPYYPATRFGYISLNKDKVFKFKEKPDLESSKKYVNNKSENYLWNSGVLFFKNKVMFDEIAKNYKDIINDIKLVIQNSDHNNNILTLNKSLFSNIESVSIDYGILEKYKNGNVIEYKNYWTDIDGFKSLYDYLEKDKSYNLIQSNIEDNIIPVDTKNSFIYSEYKLVTTLGLDNMVVIDTRDSLLVASKDSTPEIHKIIKTLKSQGRNEHIVNPVCYKPWGWYINLDGTSNSGFRVQKVCIYPNNRLSLQVHKERSEHITIVKGNGRLQLGDDIHDITINQSYYIPKGVTHRLENIGDINFEYIETQIGSYLSEDDIIRYDDDFGR